MYENQHQPDAGDLFSLTPKPDARKAVHKRLEAGEAFCCPVCDQFCKVYRRKITSSMAMVLVYLERYFRSVNCEEWLHVENYLKNLKSAPASLRGDFSKLRFWNLIEAKAGRREDENRSVGLYKITQAGIDFVKANNFVPKYIYIYNNEVIKYGESTTNISEALGEKFNYAEIMAPAEVF